MSYELFSHGKTEETMAAWVEATVDDLPMDQIEALLYDALERLRSESAYPDGDISNREITPLIDHFNGDAIVGYEIHATFTKAAQ